jgi:hypothetical protein
MNNLERAEALEDSPLREGGPIRRFGYNAKCADGSRIEYASALRRFLCSQVGQEWDYVYSLICLKAKAHTKWAKWAIEHLEWTVEFDCTEEGGKVYDPKGNRVESWGRPEFYVTRSSIYQGILKRAPERPRYIHPKRTLPEEGLNYYQINGAFFEVHFRKFSGTTDRYHRLPIRTEFDVLTKTSLTWRDCQLKYGGLISWKKRQLSKREIKRLGLRESNEA